MNCPACLDIMYCGDLYTDLVVQLAGCEVITLKCQNIECPAAIIGVGTKMSVLVHSPDPWKCIDYLLPIKERDDWYILSGNDDTANTTQLHKRKKYDWNIKATQYTPVAMPNFTIQTSIFNPQSQMFETSGLFDWSYKEELATIDFEPISTGNDMHYEAWKLFRRLKELSIYA